MREIILNAVPFLQSLLYKTSCSCCGVDSNYAICKDCLNKFEIHNFAPIRRYNNIPFYSVGKYDNTLRKAIIAFKFDKRQELSYDLSNIIFNYWKCIDISKQLFQIVPIPIHKNKMKLRGYDQTRLITNKLSFLFGYKNNNKLLERVKDTKPQFKLTIEERESNLNNAFKLNKKYLYNLPVLLFDDICTTGSTLKEAIKTLNSSGINDITVLTLSDVSLN